MKRLTARHQIKVGSKLKIGENIKTGIFNGSTPYWMFPVAMREEMNGRIEPYDWVWLKVVGQFPFEVGDWVIVNKIVSYCSQRSHNQSGGMMIHKIIEVEVEKAKWREE